MEQSILQNALFGLSVALELQNLLYCIFGVVAGTILGVIPGIGVLTAISMLFPLTYGLDPTAAIVMLGGIFYGTTYGGSTASILLNVPGTPANAIACLEGYPMAKQGRAGVALLMTTVASYVGGTFGIILLMAAAPVLAGFALKFGAQEYFSIMLLGIVAASTVGSGSPIKGLAMVVVGILIGIVGRDVNSGVDRFTFGSTSLIDGVSLVALAMGIFGITEIILSIGKVMIEKPAPGALKLKNMLPTKDDLRRSVMPMVRGAGIGSFFGTLPGTGGMIAAFLSYAVEKKISRSPERFGNGAIEGIVGPETANNAGDQTAFIPTMSLGIPGNATMAIMLGVLILHGITPGPSLISEEPKLFWGVIMSFWIGNLMLLVLNIPFVGLWVRLLHIPYRIMFPAVVMFVCIGVYSVRVNPFDVMIVAGLGVFGAILRQLDFSMAPMILGFVLGPMMEEFFRRSMILSEGDLTTFFVRPISLTFVVVTALLLLFSGFSEVRHRLFANEKRSPRRT